MPLTRPILNLDNELVNLSACETCLGKVVQGDGMTGLVRAFQTAGARRVGVTLWSVDDEGTRDFMVAMYAKARSGTVRWADAYSQVKREFLQGGHGERYREPYYWAAFELYSAE
jgi:CHAT domain-containing protein